MLASLIIYHRVLRSLSFILLNKKIYTEQRRIKTHEWEKSLDLLFLKLLYIKGSHISWYVHHIFFLIPDI